MRLNSLSNVLVALLVVTAAVAVGVGNVTAQTAETTATFTGGPHTVEIDLSNVSSEVQIQIVTDESPIGDGTMIVDQNVSASAPSAHFRNAGAYDQFTVEVTGASDVPMEKGTVADAWHTGHEGVFLGDTGGDTDHSFDLAERMSAALAPDITQLDAQPLPGTTDVDTTDTDSDQIEIDLYQSGQNSRAGTDNTLTVMDNQLQDAQNAARITGQNAYIKALNDGASESAARTAAKQAVADYYARQQMNLLNAWETHITHAQYMQSVAQSESGINGQYATDVEFTDEVTNSNDYSAQIIGNNLDAGTHSGTLVNGSSVTATNASFQGELSHPDFNNRYATLYASPIKTNLQQDWTDWGHRLHLDGMHINPPNSNYEQFDYATWGEFNQRWQTIESQNDQVQAEMDTIVNNTYSEYQAGEINDSDLVDPYQLSADYSAGDSFQSWASAQLTSLGHNGPDAFESTGSFTVTTGGSTYQGMLFSDSNPTSGEFVNGSTYDPSAISGNQYLVTENEVMELTENFTINSIEDTSGDGLQNATVESRTYTVSNHSELLQQYEALSEYRAAVETREQNLRNSGGGALLGGSNNMGLIIIVAAIGLFLMVRDDKGGNY